MLIEPHELEYCKYQVHYEADPEVVQEKYKEVIKQVKKQAKMSGFRKGKVPEGILKTKFGDQIKEFMVKELVAVAYDDILFDTKMKPIGYPQCKSASITGNNFECDLIFLKKPDFELGTYKELEIPKPHDVPDAVAVAEHMLQQLRERHADAIPYGESDFVQGGDRVTMDIESSINGKKIDILSKEGVLYDLNGQGGWPEFDNEILGMSPGATREFKLKIPEGFPPSDGAEISGEMADVKVKIHMGIKNIPAPLDDSLAQSEGLANYDELYGQVSMIASAQAQSVELAKVAEQIVKRLVTSHDFAVPDWLTSVESQQLVAREGKKWDDLSDEVKEEYHKQATDNVKFALILDSIREKEPEAVLTDEEVINAIHQKYRDRVPDINKFLIESQANGRLLGLAAGFRDEYTLQWVAKQAKIIE